MPEGCATTVHRLQARALDSESEYRIPNSEFRIQRGIRDTEYRSVFGILISEHWYRVRYTGFSEINSDRREKSKLAVGGTASFQFRDFWGISKWGVIRD